jgi:hypothetical protein
MKTIRLFGLGVITASFLTVTAMAQQPPKPGPEHSQLKKMEGTWDTTMKMEGKEEKGVATFKMDVNGLWLYSTFDGTMGGEKFSGRGFDSYDQEKKKFTGVWVDSMSTTPMVFEGTYDPASKAKTMLTEGPGMDGPKTKYRMVTKMTDDNTMNFAMYMGNAKEPNFTIVYKRKK